MCRCGITPEFILFDQPLCLTAHTDWLIVSGRIVSTDKTSCTDITKHLQHWVENKSTVIVEGAHFTSLSQCSVFLKEGELIFCKDNSTTSDLSSPPTSSATTEATPAGDSSLSTTLTGAIIAIVLILVIVVVVFIAILTVMWRKIHTKKIKYAL